MSISKSFQSCVLSSYKIKVSASASLRFDSGDVSRQSSVDVPRCSLLFKIGGQWTLSDPLICAALNDKNERQSITIHFWLRELAMFTTVTGARGQINKSLSSIATILFDSAMIWPITELRCGSPCLLKENYIPAIIWRWIDLCFYGRTSVLMMSSSTSPRLYSLYSRPALMLLFLSCVTSLKGGFVTSCRGSRVCPDLLFPFIGGKLILRRQMSNIKTISNTFRSWQKCYQVLKWRTFRQLHFWWPAFIKYQLSNSKILCNSCFR